MKIKVKSTFFQIAADIQGTKPMAPKRGVINTETAHLLDLMDGCPVFLLELVDGPRNFPSKIFYRLIPRAIYHELFIHHSCLQRGKILKKNR